MALSNLQPRYHALVFTVDVLHWLGSYHPEAHTAFWPCYVNILEHFGCSSGSPGALYLNNIMLYRYLHNIYYHGQKLISASG